MSINKAIIVGFTTKDPEVKEAAGTKVATFSLATNEKGYTLANGTQVPDRAEYHNIVAWRGLAELSEKWIRKGSPLYIEGKITTRSWEKDGQTHYRTEIVAENIQLLGKKPEQQNTEQQQAQPSRATQQPGFATSDGKDGKDDLPFNSGSR